MVGLVEPITGGFGDDTHLRRQAQEFNPVLPREIRNRHELSLFPKQPIRETWNVTHVNPRANDASTLVNCFQSERHEIAHGRKNDCRIKWLRRQLVRTARPERAEASSEGLGGQISGSRKGKHGSSLPFCHLRDDMGRSTKAVEPNLFPFASDDQRTPTD